MFVKHILAVCAIILINQLCLATEDSWSHVSAGARHTCARVKANHCHGPVHQAGGVCSTEGSIECFGDNSFGQSTPPTGKFAKVSAGRDTSCALRLDGAVVCWGNPESGVVTAAPHAYGFQKLSVGGFHACAIKNGKVFCWGDNDYGQCTPPEADMEFTDISAGTHHSCGVQRNGKFSLGSVIDSSNFTSKLSVPMMQLYFLPCAICQSGVFSGMGFSQVMSSAGDTTEKRKAPDSHQLNVSCK